MRRTNVFGVSHLSKVVPDTALTARSRDRTCVQNDDLSDHIMQVVVPKNARRFPGTSTDEEDVGGEMRMSKREHASS